MPEIQVKIEFVDGGKYDLTEMTTITRQQFRDAAAYGLAELVKTKPDKMSDKTLNIIVQMCGAVAAGTEGKLFGDVDEKEEEEQTEEEEDADVLPFN